MTFRTRLLLAILGVVVFTTAVSLLVAQRQHGSAYRTLGDELLSNQEAWFQRLQSGRQQQAAAMVGRLAGSVRLFAALEAQDPAVYQIAGDELRLGEFSFFRLLDASGQLIEPPVEYGTHAPALPTWLTEARGFSTAANPRVELGYVLVPGAEDGGIFRILAAQIRNFDRRVGTLLLGQRVTALGQQATDGGTLAMTHSAFWLDDQLAGAGLPPDVRTPLEAALAASPRAEAPLIQAGESSYRYEITPLNPDSAYPPAYLVSLFSMDGFVAEQRDLSLRIVLTGLAAALIAGLMALALSRQLAEPIRNLVSATERIGRGDLEHRLDRSSTVEFDHLAGAFNQMAEDLSLKDRYRSVLNQIADAEVADALVTGEIELGGELREVTVMFCDIRDYTQLTTRSSPEAVIELLNTHYATLAEIVRAHRGVINQFVGDAIMALFGAPKQYGDDASRATRCALAMVEARAEMNREAQIPMQIGIGIASGPVVAGCIGDERRSDYTAVGEHVNLAARLSAVAEPGEILNDLGTRERLDNTAQTEPSALMALKGLGDDVQAFRVTGRPAA